MSLVLGLIAGLAFGLSTFGGSFLAVPLLVVGADIGLQASLPIALAALALCSAISAGDAARARQCDIGLAGLLFSGGLPFLFVGVWAAQQLSSALLVTVFVICALVSGAFLFEIKRDRRTPPIAAAALGRAPRRAWADVTAARTDPMKMRAGLVFAGGCSALVMASCAAPGAWLCRYVLRRMRATQPYEIVGTLLFATAPLAVLGAMVSFMLAPAVSGYTAGLFVLGAVAGAGVARRVSHSRLAAAADTVTGIAVMAAALILWLAVVTGWRGDT